MKLMFALSSVLSLFFSVQAFARPIDSETMYSCGGRIELNLAGNGDLSIQLENMTMWRCNSLRFSDYTSGRVLKSYDVLTSTSSFTLSRQQRDSLSSDCRLSVEVWGWFGAERFTIEVPEWCSSSTGKPSTGKPSTGYSYQWSASHNCKVMKFGVYTNENTRDIYCQGATTRNDVVTYEFSNKGNCKLMVNGQYTNFNVEDYFCTAGY